MSNSQLSRRLPSVERLLDRDDFRALEEEFGRGELLAVTRSALAELRQAVREERLDEAGLDTALASMESSLKSKLTGATTASLVPLVNATGIIVHSDQAASRVLQIQQRIERGCPLHRIVNQHRC